MKNDLRVHLALFGVALIYGSTYTIAKGVMPEYLGPSGFIFIRIFIAAILFNVIGSFREKVVVKDKRDYLQMAVAAFFGVASNMMFFFNGLAYTTELNASVLMLNAPVFVLIFSRFVLKDKIRTGQAIGIGISAIGALLLIGGLQFRFTSDNALGDFMVLINAVCFAYYLVYVKRLLVKYSALFVIRKLFIFGTFFVLPFAISDLRSADFGSFPDRIWLSIAFVCIMTTFVAYLLNTWAVQKASPNLVGAYIYLQPVIATFVSIYTGNQSLSWEKVIFALVIFVGVYMVNSNRRKA